EIENIVDLLQKSENHYLREENVLFSYLEKYGVTQPPKIMWIEHDRIRDLEKNLISLIKNKGDHDFPTFLEKFHLYAHGLAEMLASHFPKENKILYPTAMKLLKDSDWVEVRKQFDDIGYFSLSPDVIPAEAKIEETKPVIVDEKQVDLGTGVLDLEILQQIFKTLPVDTTFVDKDDVVKFYSEGPDRVFIRTPSVIGRLVENCHPSKSVDKVMKIIESFKNKTLDKAEFWLELGDRLIFIRYFPVRNKAGEYLGVLEVTQDITDIRKIEGEKRLL
ncbi:MAG: PAS domain-containing protein, partial [Candidatus Heimdallarchaeaceae archaeon]